MDRNKEFCSSMGHLFDKQLVFAPQTLFAHQVYSARNNSMFPSSVTPVAGNPDFFSSHALIVTFFPCDLHHARTTSFARTTAAAAAAAATTTTELLCTSINARGPDSAIEVNWTFSLVVIIATLCTPIKKVSPSRIILMRYNNQDCQIQHFLTIFAHFNALYI
jgi:hypothetical protein